LFLGGAESLWQVTDRFEAVQLGGSFVYQRCGEVTPVLPRREERPGRAAPLAGARANPRSSASRPQHPPRLEEEPPQLPQAARAAATAGREALAADDHDGAVVAFRKWVYLAPDDPLASLHLGLALEAGGHPLPARRAYGVSRAVLHRIGFEGTEESLGGFAVEELMRLLDTKQGIDS
jgi:chemotaxis protein methyltransferase CheR